MAETYIPAIVWRVCARKEAYKTKREARLAGYFMRAKTGARLRSYRCPFCSMYHVGKAGRIRD